MARSARRLFLPIVVAAKALVVTTAARRCAGKHHDGHVDKAWSLMTALELRVSPRAPIYILVSCEDNRRLALAPPASSLDQSDLAKALLASGRTSVSGEWVLFGPRQVASQTAGLSRRAAGVYWPLRPPRPLQQTHIGDASHR